MTEASGSAVIRRPSLATDRLALRPLRPDDAERVHTAVQDAVLQRWFPAWIGATRVEIDEHVARGEQPDSITLAVSAEDVFVGECWLADVDATNGTAQAGYWIVPAARGAGYAAEALAALVDWAFAELAVQRVEVHAAELNVASQRVALRAGFQWESIRRDGGRSRDGVTDVAVYVRLRDDPVGPAKRRLPDVAELSDGFVVVRPMRAEDADDWYRERTDPDVVRWSGRLDVPDRESVRRRAAATAAAWLAGIEARFAVLEGGEYAGHVQLRMTEPDIGVAEVGYATHPDHRRRGLMQRSLPLVARWAFDEVGLARVTAGVGATNVASLRTAERAGFRREGILRSGLPGPNGRYDLIQLSMLPTDLAPR